MTWQVLARRDLRELLADRTLLYFCGFFALVGGGVSLVAARGQSPTPLAGILAVLLMFGVPLTGGTIVHEAIPRSVTSGRVRLTLSLPHTREAFVAGAGAAALAATLAATGVGALAALAVYVFRGAPVDVFVTVQTLAVTALLGAAFVGATLAFTARSRSTTLAAATTYGFFLLSFVWPGVVAVGSVVLTGQFGVPVPQQAVDTVVQLSPIYAYQNAVSAVGGGLTGPTGHLPEWGGVVVLLAWASLGYAVAAHRFGGIDL
ncbi:ABC transporter permease subunit [Halobacterium wangiae]|uniref:ABC transporter permease subunit n=1 Tax=Halobacterium wangiae TaxID=2902623 RepID=UPI001E50E9B2|nr:ABC transporter permease subunit [Halobacterium wangiae]